ncbi:hypothetical protein H5410_014236 [Solanum commersonii]|uniref:Uncharacterized protein n=1 Tax=Solanum commersonii TaxID=4109 RepID=A0A9J5ZQS7_SOLCO|nr:hypothetical protein H5410_014236 [Solanum commersonii]
MEIRYVIEDATTGEILCVEGGKRDAKALSIVESKNYDSYYIPEIEVENYILDTNISNVKVKQLYKDKTTLMAVMVKYKIKHTFNFRVKRSDSKRPMMRGFEFCRPVVVDDASHLSRAYRGTFVSASTLDGQICHVVY